MSSLVPAKECAAGPQGKTLLTAITVFLGTTIAGIPIVLACSFLCFASLAIVNYRIQPCRGKGAVANNLRTASFTVCVFGTGCAFAAYVINNVRGARPGPVKLCLAVTRALLLT